MKRSRSAKLAATVLVWGASALAEGWAGDDSKLNQHRPQEESIAATPLPYREELVTFDNPAAAGARLAGTLSLPQGMGRFPAIVYVAGSGENDRNEEIAGHKLALVLADALARQGYAVLRYDKRGVAKSTGDYSSATTLDFASDATAAVGYLRHRPDIDIARSGLVGHSEGGTIAALVAAKDPDLAFIVMMGGFALPGKILVAEQIRRVGMVDGQTRAAATRTFNLNRRLYDAIAASADEREAEARVREILEAAKPKPTKDDFDQAILFAKLPYMRFILGFDPTAALSKVRIPVLALCGSKDLVVPPDLNVPALRKALSRDQDVTVVEVPGLNHLFQHAQTGSPREFARIEETLAPEVLSLTSHWIEEHTR
jgi:pimeloyl-ACP methyl ester carboxylesterase